MVIWANHMPRAAVSTMQKPHEHSKQSENLLSIEDKVAPVSEIFRLQNAAELLEAEERYLPRGAEGTSAVVLAASRGERVKGKLTEDQPKTMVKNSGRRFCRISSMRTMPSGSKTFWWCADTRKTP